MNASKHGLGDTLAYILLFPILFTIDTIEDIAINLSDRRRQKAFDKKHPDRYSKR